MGKVPPENQEVISTRYPRGFTCISLLDFHQVVATWSIHVFFADILFIYPSVFPTVLSLLGLNSNSCHQSKMCAIDKYMVNTLVFLFKNRPSMFILTKSSLDLVPTTFQFSLIIFHYFVKVCAATEFEI